MNLRAEACEQGLGAAEVLGGGELIDERGGALARPCSPGARRGARSAPTTEGRADLLVRVPLDIVHHEHHAIAVRETIDRLCQSPLQVRLRCASTGGGPGGLVQIRFSLAEALHLA